jgi:hypothetical protein
MRSSRSKAISGCLAFALLGVLAVNAVAGPAPPVVKKSDGAGRLAKGTTATDEAPELTEKTVRAIEKGLRHLAKNLNANRTDRYKTASNALALMAFMVEGHFPGEGTYGDALNKALANVLTESKSSNDGYLGESMYEHGLATLALSELWGMVPDKDDEIYLALTRAVRVILRAQNIVGGWRYKPTPTDTDLSVTIMQIVALASARQAGIMIPEETIRKALRMIRLCWHRESGGFTYQPHGGSPGFARSAGAVYTLQLLGHRDSDQVKAGMRYLWNMAESSRKNTGHYYYAHYYAIQAMVQSSDDDYGKWYPKIRDALLAKQSGNGSWSGHGGGSVSTSMAIILLGTPCRYIPIYQR